MALSKIGSAGLDTLSGNLIVEGNVGVGTSSPNGKLQVKQANTAYGLVVEASGTDAWMRVHHNDSVGIVETTYNASAGYTPLTFKTGGSERLRIDSAGCVTMPYQPAFQVTLSSTQSFSANVRTKVAFDTIDYANGSDYNTTNKRFTAPVTGWYQFNCWTYGYTVSNNELTLYKNGGLYLRSQWASPSSLNNVNAHLSVVTKLTAGDYVEMWTALFDSGQLYHSGDRPTVWSGILIG